MTGSPFPRPNGGAALAPSLLAADSSDFRRELSRVSRSADWIHVDVMDGHFVPNLSFGPAVVSDLSKASKLPLDVHLMVEKPLAVAKDFASAGADLLTIHLEACPKPRNVLKSIRKLGPRVGLSIKPRTNVKKILPYLKEVDLILIMTVEPGFGGQSFMPTMESKIRTLRHEIDKGNRPVWLQVDGGINKATAARAGQWGANSFVAGNAVFKSSNPTKAARAIKEAADKSYRASWN